MICPICNGTLFYNVPPKACYRCKGRGTVSDSWEEPDLPDIHRIRELAREVGYAVAVHGSEKRDYDLIASPWVETAVGNADLVEHLCKYLPATMLSMSRKPFGRYAVNLQMNGPYRLIDLSIAPKLEDKPAE